VLAAFGIVGHLYGAHALYAVAAVSGIALQTATMIAALGVALVVALPEHGLAAALRRDDPGGVMFRALLAPMVLLSIVIGGVRLTGERHGFYDTAFGTASRTVVEIILFIALVWWTAARVSRHARIARAAEEALRDGDRRKDEFLATLAHELRNPLAPLRTSLEIARRNPGDAAAVARAHGIMQRQLDQMVHLVDDLLDINRIARGTIELRRRPVDVVSVVDEAIESSRPVIEAFGHELKIVRPLGPIVVDGDVTRLTQVLANLLNNAAKYTEPGGHIRIAIERAAGEVRLKVRDDGPGIPAELQPALFAMFTRSSAGRGGLGIGLALVRQLVEMHGGRVSVHSPPPAEPAEPGQPGQPGQPAIDGEAAAPARGTEFVVCLPTIAGEAAPLPLPAAPLPPPAPAPAADVAPPRARLRVLIADDNVDAAETLAELLEDLGYETRVANDGEAALAAAAASRPDIAFLDLGMPKLGGHEVGERIRAAPWGRNVVLVALTGWGRADDRRKSTQAGFDEHLVKPATVEMLEKVMATADANARARSSAAAASA
jgi:signal transduction histidine kinase/ActR/RegA family two-component response regulator